MFRWYAEALRLNKGIVVVQDLLRAVNVIEELCEFLLTLSKVMFCIDQISFIIRFRIPRILENGPLA
jgi:hypothetical protein